MSGILGFEWELFKEAENRLKHGVSFRQATSVFDDPQRIVSSDAAHSAVEERFYFVGRTDGGILTVRFTCREGRIRIFGAGYWRKGKALYEKANQIH